MKKEQFAFGRTNFILLAIGITIVILGLVLMSGSGSTETHFNPEIFSALRIKTAPSVCLLGYLFMIFAILWRPAGKHKTQTHKTEDNE